jgi:hypothetical protein
VRPDEVLPPRPKIENPEITEIAPKVDFLNDYKPTVKHVPEPPRYDG